MKCFKEKQLILLYYGELKANQVKLIRKHLGECPDCFKRYEDIKAFSARLTLKPPQLIDGELEDMLKDIKAKVRKPNLWTSISYKINHLLENVRLGVSNKPQLVPVLVALILILVFLPFVGKKERNLDKEFDILRIEIELSLDNLEGSIFELYEEELILMDELSSIKIYIPHKRIGIS